MNIINVKVENFKCFHDITVPLNFLTVFAGANGNGKSTIIQSLLFLRRTFEHCARWGNQKYDFTELNGLNVELNDVYCLSLGNSAYILPTNFNSTEVLISLLSDVGKFSVTYSTNSGKELWLTPVEPLVNEFENNPLSFQEFYYLNAERIGPRLSHSIKFYDYPNVGFKGEYTAQVIAELNYSFKVEEERINKEFLTGNRFEHHVNSWLSFIIPGTEITAYYDDQTHTARIEVQNNRTGSNPIVPTNTGFGISYALPIIVSGLIAKKDRILIVENPEAHLHPSAQSKMGIFLATIANAGVRVIIETHSDHIINGIQLAVIRKNVSSQNVTINFFNKPAVRIVETNEEAGADNQEGVTQSKLQPEVVTIGITPKGELTQWPKGFFDQSQIDLAELFKFRRA